MTTESSSGVRHVEYIAFLAKDSRLGRTAAIANIALVLAGARKRVLIVDWSGEESSARGYFERFGVGPAVNLGVLSDEFTERCPGDWQAARFQPPGRIQAIDLVARAWAGGDGRVSAPPGREQVENIVAWLRDHLDNESGYDHVLMDTPTDPGQETIDAVARGADQVVVLFEPNAPSIAGAATIAEELTLVTDVRVLPLEVGPRRDGAQNRRVSQMPVTEWFADFLLDGDEPILKVPVIPHYQDRRILATLAEEPGSEPARAYTRLVAELTAGEVTESPQLPAALRGNYRAAVGMDEPQYVEQFTIVYTWPYRRHADWVRAQLKHGGARAVLADPAGEVTGRAIWIVSSDLLDALPDGLPPREGDLALLAPGNADASVPAGMHAIALDDGSDGQVRLRLLGRLGLVPGTPRTGARAFAPRFPLAQRQDPLRTNFPMPPRSTVVDREDTLAALRDRLTDDDNGYEPQVLSGPPGIGKTAVAREYLRLFGDDYDTIWWIPARTTDLVRLGLSKLADALEVAPQGDKAAAAVGALRARVDRWILVYDDADDLASLDGLLPTGGTGHVIVTTRAPAGIDEDAVPDADVASAAGAGAGSGAVRPPAKPGVQAVVHTLARLTPIRTAHGAKLLQERVNGLPQEHAGAIAELLQGLPLALHLAAAWLRQMADWLAGHTLSTEAATASAAREYCARVQAHLADGRSVPAACLAVSLQTLADAKPERSLDRLAVRVMELCAWLAPEGSRHSLLSSAPFLDGLAEAAGPEDGAVLKADSMVLDQVLRICVQHGLAEMVWKQAPTFRVHRMVQELIREWLADSGLAEVRHGQVLRALARTVPPAVNGPLARHGERFRDLRRHLWPSGAAQSLDRWVRRWIVEQMRYEYDAGDQAGQREMLALAERLCEHWPDDLLTGRLLGQAANICRVESDFKRAYAHGERALSILGGLAAAGEHWTLAERRGRSGDLRGLGKFAESLGEIQGVYERTRLLFGDDHRETGIARINLAESAFLMGQYPLARETATATWEQRKAEFGEDDWKTLQVARRVGEYQGANGDWHGARWLLDNSYSVASDMSEPNQLAKLELLRSLAVAVRHVQRRVADHRRISGALRGLRDLLGRDHPSVLATELSLGIELVLVGNHRAAIRRAERCRDGLASRYGADHPFVQLCKVDVGGFMLAAGKDGEVALRTVQEAGDALIDALGEQHPWAMVAVLHQCRALCGLGRFDEAQERAERTAADALNLLGGAHPYTVAAVDARQAVRARDPRGAGDPRTAIYLDVPFI